MKKVFLYGMSFISITLLFGCKAESTQNLMKKDQSQISSKLPVSNTMPSAPKSLYTGDKVFDEYIAFFEEVYDLMDKNYYAPVNRGDFENFVENFKTKLYPKFIRFGKSVDYIRWRSASYLVGRLKTKEDIFSEFYPPKPAKEYEQTALGVRTDIGIEGKKTDKGFEVFRVEPRSDAYEKGLREQDLILVFNGKKVADMTDQEAMDAVNPLQGTETNLVYLSKADKSEKTITVVIKEYFKQTVFPFSTGIPYVYGLKLERFNKATSQDMLVFMNHFMQLGPIQGIIMDMRNNPGGPPLAAREISAFFLTPGEKFAYFHKKGHAEADLDVPVIPEKFRYQGPMAILINNQSGSASELFSGVLQRKQRAILIGTNSAGQVMLKSMFPLKDESMLLLITARGQHSDGSFFSFNGLTPDFRIPEGKEYENDLMETAVKYCIYENRLKQKSK